MTEKESAAPHRLRAIAVTGPTATGKTRLAVELARRFRGEIVSVDSRQVYRGMDLGTGKDLADYAAGGEIVPYHLIDIVDPAEEYHLAAFCRDARQAIREISGRGRLPILAGGTPLYLAALLDDYELAGGAPDAAERARLDALPVDELARELRRRCPDYPLSPDDWGNRNRLRRALEIASGGSSGIEPLALDALVLGVYFPRETVRRRIAGRLDARLAAGLIAEVRYLHEDCGISYERLEFFGLEYREVARFLQGQCSREEMREVLLNRIRQFAKRQDIFFRKLEREGHAIHWLDGGDPAAAASLVHRFLAGEAIPPPAFRLADLRYPRSV